MSRSLRRRASQWLVRMQADEVSEADRAAFTAWLAADPRHAAAFRSVASAVDQVRALKGELYNPIEAKPPRRRFSRAAIAGAGAALAAAIALVWLGGALPKHYTSAIGEQHMVTLEDGSVVELNTDTEIIVNYTAQTRRVRLDRGEALFHVSGNARRPFEVEAGGRSVRAIGTAFVVRMDGAALSVTVTEGVVDVGRAQLRLTRSPLDVARDRRVRVSAQQRFEISDREGVIRALDQDEIVRTLAWREGMLRFDGDLLRDVVKDVERHTGARFTITDPALEELHVVAYLRANNLDGFIARLEESFPDLAVRRSGDLVRIEPRAGRHE